MFMLNFKLKSTKLKVLFLYCAQRDALVSTDICQSKLAKTTIKFWKWCEKKAVSLDFSSAPSINQDQKSCNEMNSDCLQIANYIASVY